MTVHVLLSLMKTIAVHGLKSASLTGKQKSEAFKIMGAECTEDAS